MSNSGEYITKPLLSLDRKGHADVLFVLPYEQRQFDENVLSNQAGKELKETIEETFRSYAVITLKKTSGPWSDTNIEPHVREREDWLKKKIARYTPNVVVFMGVNIARFLIPEVRDANSFDLLTSFQRWKLSKDNTQLCFVYTQLNTLFKDYEMRSRFNENIAKIYVASRGRDYHSVGDYENMDYKSARSFLKHLIHDEKGYVAFDTETYSLNQVHGTRLGAMQFSTNTSESKLMLWDTDKSPYSASQKEKLITLLAELFSSKKTNLTGWIMHNAIFDMNQVRATFGVRFPYEKIIRDTWLRMHLMDENRIARNEGYALKKLAKEFFGFIDYDKEAIEARSNGVIMELPTKKLVNYAGNDTVCTYRLDKVIEVWAHLDDYYESLTKMTNHLHNNGLRLYSEMKVNGMLIDMHRLAELLSPTSVIKKRLTEIRQAYRDFPEIKKVNDDMYMKQVGKRKLFRIPFVFDMDKPTYRNELFFHNENGFKYPPTGKDDETGKPKYSSGKAFQESYEHVNPVVKLYKEAQGLGQLKKMYIQPIYLALQNKLGDVVDGRVHPNFNMAGTVTGRLSSNDPNCVVEGTPVSIPCDYVKNSTQTKPIEKLKVGEYVFCLDNKRNLAVRKVTNKWFKGEAKIVRLYYKSNNGRFKGHLDVTLDHEVRSIDGRWVEAQNVNVGDRLIALGLYADGNYHLTNKPRDIAHRAIARSLSTRTDIAKLEVHHKDGNHSNNSPKNLQLLTPEKHGLAHRVLGRASKPRAYENRYSAIRLLFKLGGRLARCRALNVGYIEMLKRFDAMGISLAQVRKRFGQDGKYISKATLANNLSAYTSDQTSKNLRVGSRVLKELCSFYGLKYGTLSKKANQPKLSLRDSHLSLWTRKQRKAYVKNTYHGFANHVITKVKYLKSKKRVWDIEVEEYHNFFANHINVHNCQQIPRSDTPTKKAIKALFVAPPGYAVMQADFAAAEVRMWGAMSKDPNLCELLQESFRKRGLYRKKPDDEKLKVAAELMGDVHKQTASLMFGVDLYSVNWKDSKYKDMRQTTKSITFGLMYGRGTPSVAQQINKTIEETEELKGKFFGRFKAGEAWLDDQKTNVKRYGYVETPLGRRRRCPQVFSGDKKLVKEAERYAVNAPIQATASDYAVLATSLLHRYFVENDLTDKFKIINAVHDSVVIQFPANKEDMVFLAKLIRRLYTEEVQVALKRDFDFTLLAPMDIDLEVSYRKYKKCKKCGATHMMADVICDNGVDKGKKDKDGKPVKEPCLSEKFDVEKLRYHAYGYLTELVETKQGFADAALGL